jgi:Uncharacterised protein family (UPF0175)
MNLVVRIPDDLAQRLGAGKVDLERRALEALVADEYRAGRMTKPEVYSVLGFEALDEFDGFLKAHGVYEDYTPADLERERQALDRLGI